jgi:hypothetical protein
VTPAVRIIPERTIDAWTSSAILAREPHALVWAPTPPAPAAQGTQPWHFPIGAFDPPSKLLVLENKALIGRLGAHHLPKVCLELDQLARLIDLEVDGLPILYGLPGLCDMDLPSLIPREELGGRAALRFRPHFDRWQRLVRPLELLALRPVMKAMAANRHRMTLNTLALVGFPPLRAFLSDTQQGSWGRNLLTDPQDRADPLLPPFKPDPIVNYAVRRAACMGHECPAILKRRLIDIYAQPDVRARIEDRNGEPVRVDAHLSRTIWMVLPTVHKNPDHRERTNGSSPNDPVASSHLTLESLTGAGERI